LGKFTEKNILEIVEIACVWGLFLVMVVIWCFIYIYVCVLNDIGIINFLLDIIFCYFRVELGWAILLFNFCKIIGQFSCYTNDNDRNEMYYSWLILLLNSFTNICII
jgi:hypothetical protein